jgi:hypothetical protein
LIIDQTIRVDKVIKSHKIISAVLIKSDGYKLLLWKNCVNVHNMKSTTSASHTYYQNMGHMWCPGPDGFNFAFVKAFWRIIKGEIRIMFDQFHGIGTLPHSFSSYFVTLIPKVNSPFSLGDFRPILLLGCLYKIVAKVLTAWLARVMDGLVAST